STFSALASLLAISLPIGRFLFSISLIWCGETPMSSASCLCVRDSLERRPRRARPASPYLAISFLNTTLHGTELFERFCLVWLLVWCVFMCADIKYLNYFKFFILN